MKLSVRVITYNHAPFIARALDGALEQAVDWEYEIVVGEDCSTDGTRDIVVDYGRRHPDRIRLLLSDANVGGRRNFVRTLEACRGQYVALLDGDDYWTAPDKLRRQVEFLDRHPDHAIAFHDALAVDETGGQAPRRLCGSAQPRTSTLTDLLGGNFIPTCTAVLRRTWDRLPAWLPTLPWCDWPLHLLAAARGKIGYLDEVMAVYRIHAGGASRRLVGERYLDGKIEILRRIDAHLGHRYERVIRASVARAWVDSVFSDAETDRCWLQATPGDIARALDRWPAALALGRRERRRALAAAFARVGLQTARRGDARRGSAWFRRAARLDPAWVWTPGFWSVGMEAWAGKPMADRMRRALGNTAARRSPP